MTNSVPVVIIGGGVVGCAIACELSKFRDDIFVIEKNDSIISDNQSSRNSGVIHAGVYYARDKSPLKAGFCVEGNDLMYHFCSEHNIPHKRTGKLVVATNPLEEEYLREIVLSRAIDNGVPNIEMIDARRVSQLEPNVKATCALLVPSSGIVDPTSIVRTFRNISESRGVNFLTGCEVVSISPKRDYFIVTARSRNFEDSFDVSTIINSAGLYSDDVARMVNPDSPYEITPVRGESAKFYNNRRENIFTNGMNIYPAPHGFYNQNGNRIFASFSKFKKHFDIGIASETVGIHLTSTFDIVGGRHVIGSTVTMGPTTTVGVGKEDFSSGLHPEEHYLDNVIGYFPNIRLDDITLHQSGIRAKLKGHYDFVIERDPKYQNLVNLIGIDSPGLTCCIPIAKYVCEMMKDG